MSLFCSYKILQIIWHMRYYFTSLVSTLGITNFWLTLRRSPEVTLSIQELYSISKSLSPAIKCSICNRTDIFFTDTIFACSGCCSCFVSLISSFFLSLFSLSILFFLLLIFFLFFHFLHQLMIFFILFFLAFSCFFLSSYFSFFYYIFLFFPFI